MSKRYLVLGLSVVLALALAVPALGGPSNPIASVSASVKSTANKALKKAKAAQATANTANATAGTALTEAQNALKEAKKAQTSATTAKSAADAAQTTANTAKTAAAAAEANANSRVKSSVQVVGEQTAENTTANKFASASCASGQVVLGGGYSVGGEANKVTISSSETQLYGGGWFVAGNTINGQTANWSLLPIVMCGTK